MDSNKQYIVTIEICSSKIVGVVGEKSPGGSVSVVAIEADSVSPDCVRRGFVQNVEEAKQHVQSVIKRLESHISPSKIRSVYVGVAGRSLHNMPVEIDVELDPNQLISEDIINNIVRKCRSMNIEGEILDVVPCIYELDGSQETRTPIGSYSSRIKAKMNHILAKTTLKRNLNRVFDSIIKVQGYMITPLVVADRILNNDERQLGCMLVDFGAETTTVSIYKNDALRYIATLPMGSRLITLDITNMNIIESKAEDLKRTVNSLELEVKNEPIIDGVKVTDVSNYVVARVGEICANIAEQINYAGLSVEGLAAGVTLIGGGSRLNGFSSYLEKTLKLKVVNGHHCPYVNILTPDAGNFEYIQSVALVATAAEMINHNDNCVYTPKEKPVEPPVTDEVTDNERDERDEQAERKPRAIDSILSTVKWKIANIFKDGDDESDDDNYSDDDEKSVKY